METKGTKGTNIKSVCTALLCLLMLLVTACNAEPASTSELSAVEEETLLAALNAAEQEPRPAHDFTLARLDGNAVQLSELRGRWVLVNFWATWCTPCIAEMPYLQSLSENRADQLTVLGINMRESPEEAKRFAREHGITFPLLLKPDDETLLAYNVTSLPRTLIVNPEGEIVREYYGQLLPSIFDPWLEERLD